MRMAEVTVLHDPGTGKLELFPSLEADSSLLGDSLRMACSDGNPLWDMLPTTTSASSPSVIDSSC
jgi:hypothetical protein